jgi:hypothetical protein
MDEGRSSYRVNLVYCDRAIEAVRSSPVLLGFSRSIIFMRGPAEFCRGLPMRTCGTLLLGLLCILSFSCKDRLTAPGAMSPVFYSWAASNCLNTVPNVRAERSAADSVFFYTFSDNLVLNFQVTANCCPDSNRFFVTAAAGTDTIVVTVGDTASGACRCLCYYMIHVVYNNLPGDHYVVRCIVCSGAGCDDPAYLERVVKSSI